MAKYSYHRVDANAKEIREALEAHGATVDPRCPGDYLVGFQGRTFLLEVKTKTGKLRPSQERFRARWRGQYDVVRSVADALIAVGAK